MEKIVWKTWLIFLFLHLSICPVKAGVLDTLENFVRMIFSRVENFFLSNDEEYDFVIVGAGAAGCVLANRLTEANNWRVLLLEAGEEENLRTGIPLNAPTLRNSGYYWDRYSEPSETGQYCSALVEGRCNWGTGKAIGGSTVVNFMMYSRGSPVDYDNWEAQGNPGWAYQHVLPYFLKSENSKLLDANERFHGHGGYLDVTRPPYKSELGRAFLQAGLEMGHEIIDYNSDRIIGFAELQANLRDGQRLSANKAFLMPIRQRSNLEISELSTATRILIDPKRKKAVGVEFVKDGLSFLARARKEVIVSAGALSSPQLLMLSGIGPEEHLESLNIPIIQNLPVGLNLHDHISFPFLMFLVNQSVTIVGPKIIFNPLNAYDYFIRGTGVYTLPGGADGISFFNTKDSRSETKKRQNFDTNDIPDVTSIKLNPEYLKSVIRNTTVSRSDQIADIELLLGLSAVTGDTSGNFRRLLGMPQKVYEETFSRYENEEVFSLVPVLLRPKSRGRMYLRSKNPFDLPVYEPNYFGHPDDVDTMIKGIRKGIEIASTKAFQRFNATLLPAIYKVCKDTEFDTDAYWECAIRAVSMSIGHFVGSCKMAKKENQGVVDDKLRVHGVNSLRVVDASIIPNIITGHTAAPVYMIAEKAADTIKRHWRANKV
ncbi:glucose dehydrogenase [FAD, quinone]-like [Prorops nasuta]|uniref:glucose dehydrogenase [FAD, quinone]-like n=1 Tax=Prorops nasuta TaxID=863751 RepID=UPI0034CED9BF